MPDAVREKNVQASKIAAELADTKLVYFLEIGPKFLTAAGELTKKIMPDYLHMSPQGYDIWAASIEPNVAKLMGEK